MVYIFESLKTHTYEPNIILIRLMLIMQNPEYERNSLVQDKTALHVILGMTSVIFS